MSKKVIIGKIAQYLVIILLGVFIYSQGYRYYQTNIQRAKVLEKIINRLSMDTRIADVLVTDVEYNPITQKHMTTIKFLEYDAAGYPLEPHYFTFSGNIIQFQSLVIRFDDDFVKAADAVRGRSAYLFWKVFVLDGSNTQEYEITKVNTVPDGYKVPGPIHPVEQEFWQAFWELALDSKKADAVGVKNAQIEAPGTKFIPGILYSLKIEHDGGIRIDTSEIPEILKGEKIIQ